MRIRIIEAIAGFFAIGIGYISYFDECLFRAITVMSLVLLAFMVGDYIDNKGKKVKTTWASKNRKGKG
jgi:hypothetical protein